jgi:diguanylate cyclase (GGDEF)-like protein/PAS domain S-box-containing protein
MLDPASLLQDQRQILDHLYDGLYVVDRERTIVYWNPAAERITGYAMEEVVGRQCFDNLLAHVDSEGCALCRGRCPLTATMRDGQFREALVYLRHRDGHRLPVEVRASPLRDASGAVVGAVEIFQDGQVREGLRRRLDELERLSEMDALTGVANRRQFDRRLAAGTGDVAAGRHPLSLLLIDVDRFKQVNDTWGHAGGDRVLREVAQTLLAAVREDDLVARIGGEEFAVVTRSGSPEALTGLAERLGAMVRSTHALLDDGTRLTVTASLGGAVAQAGEGPAELFVRADRALYQSKRAGRDRFTLDRAVETAAPRLAVPPLPDPVRCGLAAH